MKTKNMTTLHLRKSIGRSPLRLGLLLLPLALVLVCFALSPTARAVDPPPDGGYPNFNTAEGTDALLNLTTGFNNTAVGFDALFSNTSGDDNTAVGSQALDHNTTGFSNTAIGFLALNSNTTGILNTAVGLQALNSNTTGSANTACGLLALGGNTTGMNNTAIGIDALLLNTTGYNNTASGFGVLENNETGFDQVATGFDALFNNTTGSRNTAEGYEALFNNTTGMNNIALGFLAGGNLTTGNNNIDIGNKGVAGEANAIRIGKVGTQQATFIAGISGVTVAGGVGVIIDNNGHLGTVVSSERYKDAIKPMDKASEAILALKPVTFHYKHELDPDGIPQFGLVAEQVEKVNPDLVARDADGKAYTVRYDAVNAMLLNEFLKEHRKVEQIKKDFESKLAEQQKQIEALTSGLEKVSAQIEMSRPAPQTVVDNVPRRLSSAFRGGSARGKNEMSCPASAQN
jgi:Chaperone of endosialidase